MVNLRCDPKEKEEYRREQLTYLAVFFVITVNHLFMSLDCVTYTVVAYRPSYHDGANSVFVTNSIDVRYRLIETVRQGEHSSDDNTTTPARPWKQTTSSDRPVLPEN